jgi:hypothetical protein
MEHSMNPIAGNTTPVHRTGLIRLVLTLAIVFLSCHLSWSQSSVLIQNGIYTITSKNSGMLVDVAGDSQALGALIDQWPSTGGNNQKWILTNLGSNNYVILTNVNSAQALDVYNASKTEGAAIDQYTYSGNSNQVWQIVSKGSGYYELISKNSGMALDVTGASTKEGTDLDQWPASGSANQLWSFTSSNPVGANTGNNCTDGIHIAVRGACGFIKGANLAWLDGAYSNYLGVDPHNPSWGVSYNSTSMNAHLADMHNMGITVVRLWLFQDDQGCTLDSNGNVTGVTSTFWSNLDNTVQLAGNNGISLYFTLNNGRADLQENSTLLSNFINNAVVPLVQRYKGNQSVWAIDMMNEIDGTVAGSTGNYTTTGSTWSEAQNYMRTVASAIHSTDSNRLATTSSGWHAWNNLYAEFRGLGLDFYDYHQYADNGSIPTASSLGMDKPIYVGETGQSTARFNDATQNTAVYNFFNNGRNTGYAGVGIWYYDFAADGNYLQMLETNGSWRTIDYTLQSFVP